MKKIFLLFACALLFFSCEEMKQEKENWEKAKKKAQQVRQFDTLESVLELMEQEPTSTQERGMSVIDENADIMNILVWDYGRNGRIFMTFYNGLSSELKIGDYTRYRANLYAHEIDPRYLKDE